MYKTGMFAGKFLPPHRGHLSQIINSATQCETLYVIISDNKIVTKELCDSSGVPHMNLGLRWTWLSQELQGFPHIRVITLDETDIPVYPMGWEEWTRRVMESIPEKIDVIFAGDFDYKDGYKKWFPDSEFILFDYDRSRYPISATQIRKNPLKHWDYILGSARPFFAKKVLITGTESCGKTTLVKYLAKTYYTSWSEEIGREYAKIFLGGNENVFSPADFTRIAYMQYENDMEALKKANRVVFYDTDAVVTQYYSNIYLGIDNPTVESFVDPSRYDMTILLYPNVKWVADGQRRNGKEEERIKLNNKLIGMYQDRGFKWFCTIANTDYQGRLSDTIKLVDTLLGE